MIVAFLELYKACFTVNIDDHEYNDDYHQFSKLLKSFYVEKMPEVRKLCTKY